MNRRYLVGGILTVAVIGALIYFYGGSQGPAGQAPLESLTAQNSANIKNRFNAAKDDVRVLLLLSPT
jgi:hypothetical protein